MLEPPLPDPVSPPPPDKAGFGLSLAMMGFLGVAFLFIGAPVQAIHPAYGIWFTEIFVFFGLTWMGLRIAGRHPIHYPRLGVPGPAPLWMGLLAGTLNFFALVIPLQAMSQHLMPKALVEMFDMSRIFEQLRPMELAWMVAGVGVAAPLCEEYFFRGVLLRGLVAARMGFAAALFVSGFVFSFFHLDPVGFLARLELGVLFGFLYLRTGSLWPAIMAHAANNLVSTAIYFAATAFAGSSTETAEDPALWQLGLMLLVAGPPLYAVAQWFGRRTPMLATGDDAGPAGLRAKEVLTYFAAIFVSFGLVAALDWRAMAVNVADIATPLPAKEEHKDLDELRDATRRGEVPVKEYYARRKLVSDAAKAHGKKTPPVLPPAPMVPGVDGQAE